MATCLQNREKISRHCYHSLSGGGSCGSSIVGSSSGSFRDNSDRTGVGGGGSSGSSSRGGGSNGSSGSSGSNMW